MFEFTLDPTSLAIAGVGLPALIYFTVAALKAVGLVDGENSQEKKRANLLVGFGWAVIGSAYTLFPEIQPVANVLISWIYGSIVAALFYNLKERALS